MSFFAGPIKHCILISWWTKFGSSDPTSRIISKTRMSDSQLISVDKLICTAQQNFQTLHKCCEHSNLVFCMMTLLLAHFCCKRNVSLLWKAIHETENFNFELKFLHTWFLVSILLRWVIIGSFTVCNMSELAVLTMIPCWFLWIILHSSQHSTYEGQSVGKTRYHSKLRKKPWDLEKTQIHNVTATGSLL